MLIQWLSITSKYIIIIFFNDSPEPERLASFYREVLDIPLALNRHGNTPKHWECDFNGMHYAVLKQKVNAQANVNTVLSFRADDIEDFVRTHNLPLIPPIMDWGKGPILQVS